ncbi:hypothetical protein DYY66_1849 [Candidatus Nitrosotalea sp. FS]|nr:hypothetical protein [Candidatus Nitrosotalea sp. FS]
MVPYITNYITSVTGKVKDLTAWFQTDKIRSENDRSFYTLDNFLINLKDIKTTCFLQTRSIAHHSVRYTMTDLCPVLRVDQFCMNQISTSKFS